MPAATFPWTDPEQVRLEQLHREGLTCGQIGAALGRSRNSVIGRLMRTGLTAKGYKEGYRTRPTPKQQRQHMSVRRPRFDSKRVASLAVQTVDRMEASHPPEMRLVTLAELERGSCRFPIGDPLQDGFAYCGNDHLAGFPYCTPHARMAYQPPQERRRRVHPRATHATQG